MCHSKFFRIHLGGYHEVPENKCTVVAYTGAWRWVVTSLCHNSYFHHFTLPSFPQDKVLYFHHLLSNSFFFFKASYTKSVWLGFFPASILPLFSISILLSSHPTNSFSYCSATCEIPLLCFLTTSSSSLIVAGAEFIALLSLF